MVELNFRLWGLLGSECIFLTFVLWGQRSLWISNPTMESIYLPGLGMGFSFQQAWKNLQEGVNLNKIKSSHWLHQIICYCFDCLSLASSDLLFIPVFFFCFISHSEFQFHLHCFYISFSALFALSTHSPIWIFLSLFFFFLWMKYYVKILKFKVKLCTFGFMGNVFLHCKDAGTYLWSIKKCSERKSICIDFVMLEKNVEKWPEVQQRIPRHEGLRKHHTIWNFRSSTCFICLERKLKSMHYSA